MTLVRNVLVATALATASFAAIGAAQAAEVIVVHRGPPPLRREVVVERPGPAHLWYWQPGFWRWDGRDYDWVAGRWEHRPHARAVWIAPHWTHRRGDWVFVEGHWR